MTENTNTEILIITTQWNNNELPSASVTRVGTLFGTRQRRVKKKVVILPIYYYYTHVSMGSPVVL